MFARWRFYHVFGKMLISLCFATSVFSLIPPNHGMRSKIQEHVDEESRIATLLLKNYDKRFIPAIHGKPLDVTLNVVVADILGIDNMVAEMILHIKQTWYDYRLSWNSTKRLKIREHFLDKIWLPDVRLVNLKDVKRFEGFGGVNMNIHSDGKVYYSQAALVKTSCPMDLHRFPLDQQTCFLNFSTFAYSKSLLNYTTSGKHVVTRHTKLPQFNLVKTKETEGIGTAPGVSISLTFQRHFGYYLMSMYIPSASIVVLSWLAFFMEPSNIADRLALEITLTLTTVFLMNGVNEGIPHVSYAKASDVFVIVSFGFIFLALLETMLVFRLSVLLRRHRMTHCSCGIWGCYQVTQNNAQTQVQEGDEPDKPEPKPETVKCHCTSLSTLIDKICAILFPAMYTIFNVVYWKHYTSAVN